MNITAVATRLELLQARDTIANTIGQPSQRISNNTYTEGFGTLGQLGFLRGRIINCKKAISGDPSLKPDTKSKMLARAGEQKRTLTQQGMFELNAAVKEQAMELAVFKALQKELDNAESRIRSFDKDNPELAAMTESELQTLIDRSIAGDEPNLTTDNPQIRLSQESSSQSTHDDTVSAYLNS
jgi:hypothetical protein